MGKIEIHGTIASPATRAVLILAKTIGVSYDLIDQDPHPHIKTEEFKTLSPQHIPALVEDGFTLLESRAIMQYLVDKYAKDDALYPKDIKERATIHARLYIDAAILWPRVHRNFKLIVSNYLELKIDKSIDNGGLKEVDDAIQIIEEFLTKDKWIAGANLTIADISFSTTVGLLQAFKFDLTSYPKTMKWLENCRKDIPYHSINDEGIKLLRH